MTNHLHRYLLSRLTFQATWIAAAVLFVALAPAAKAQPPGNDTCGGASALTNGATVTMQTTEATSVGDPVPSCADAFGKGVWFTFTPATSGKVKVSTYGSDFDTVVVVYTGNCDSLTELTCNDDAGIGELGPSAVTFYCSASTTYRILAGGYEGNSGSLHILAEMLTPPANDQCNGAIALSNGSTYSMDTTPATSTGDPSPTCASGSDGVWFTYTPASNSVVRFSTCGSNYDTVLQVYTGSCGELSPVAGGCDDDSCGLQAEVTFIATGGVTYRILVAGSGGKSGMLRILATEAKLPSNDQCGGAITLTSGATFSMDTTGATSHNDPTFTCAIASNSVWFTFTPTASGAVTVSTCGSDFDTCLQVFAGTCGSLTWIDCNDDSISCSFQAAVSFSGIAGVTYHALAGGYQGAVGTLRILADFPTGQPDLAVQSLVLNKTSYKLGEAGSVTVTVVNQGGTGTGTGYAAHWFRHVPNTLGCGTTTGLYKVTNRPSLAAGGTDTFVVTFANFSAPGTFTGRLFVDGNCTITESNETNNQATVSYSVLGPDLVVQSLVLNKGTYTPKEIGSVTVTIFNQGGTGTGTGYTVDLFRHAPRLVGCGTTTYYKRVSRPALAAGGSETFVIPFVHYAADGIYTLRVFAESECVLAEANEVNNQATASYTVSGGPPDLVLQSVVLNKTNFAPGEVGSATVTIANQGSGSTLGGFSVDLFRHALAPAVCNDSTRYKRVSRPALAAGASSTFVVPYKNYTGAGNFVLLVFADGACVVPESSEVNNQATVSYSVGVGGTSIGNTGTPTGE